MTVTANRVIEHFDVVEDVGASKRAVLAGPILCAPFTLRPFPDCRAFPQRPSASREDRGSPSWLRLALRSAAHSSRALPPLPTKTITVLLNCFA